MNFTPKLLKRLHDKKIPCRFVTLHVGRGTFEPVKTENIENHIMHKEWIHLTKETANTLNKDHWNGKRIIAIGTTSARVLEACSQTGLLHEQSKNTDLFIKPGYEFHCVNGLFTNFHLPKSTLLMLVSALAGKEFIMKAYHEAIRKKYRFFSFGDAMLIL